ncbi:MAG: ATP-binding cassette domain-containing protein [Candidatus Azobacteroides sp.]|nr:ATP-binding cassette domain-containing protein [Candidatus Azobacteroides sp.]
MSITIRSLTYIHPDKEPLFSNLRFSLGKGEKASLTGNNGSGKTTLLQLMAGELLPSEGEIMMEEKPYYVPQHLGQYDEHTLSQALGVEKKLIAFHAILEGSTKEEHFTWLEDDWEIEEKIRTALSYWNMQEIDLARKMKSLSGGEKTKIFLAGIMIHGSRIILLDEPSNHLDMESREILYDFIRKSNLTMLIVSHDRTLLNLLDLTFELARNTIKRYGGNYTFYRACKDQELQVLEQELKNTEKALRKAKEVARETVARQQKLDARGKKKQDKAGLPRIMMNTLKNKAETTTSNLKQVHAEKVDAIFQQLTQLRKEAPAMNKMKIGFDESSLHKSKFLFTAEDINVHYTEKFIWQEALSFTVNSGERIAIKGANGSGKTTLIKIIRGEILPQAGKVKHTEINTLYVDQQYSLIENNLTVYQQAEKFNQTALQEHEIKMRLNRFLFTKEDWDKSCKVLSGGERMRLMLCCLTIPDQAPDILILDEPTNNLDIQNLEILTKAILNYKGTLIVVSHDGYFLNQIGITKEIQLNKMKEKSL